MRVAYQGIEGAYSEAALRKHVKGAIPVSCENFEAVFDAVTTGKTDAGLIPVENSIAGSLAANYDLLLSEDVVVIAEVFLPITHNLLAQPGTKIFEIHRVYSHPHALAQCKKFLKEKGIKAIPHYDTAGAAKFISERKHPDEGAIASILCEGIYDLKAIEKNIETNHTNVTKFFLLVRPDAVPDDLKKEKTSIAFTTKHYSGALVDCLQRLSKHSVNLSKLESRPQPENPWEYVFYADFEGGTDDDSVKTALVEIEAASRMVKVLGSYPKG